jgi:hypothetical protein
MKRIEGLQAMLEQDSFARCSSATVYRLIVELSSRQ